MDREGFRDRMKQYKKAREESPGLKYWEWKNIPKYDSGTGAVMGPPTEEQWWQEQRRYNPKIIDDYSFDRSIELLKEELHNKAMQLPGYATMWNEYVRTLPKAEPDINEFVDDLWENENPNNAGYNRTKNKYFPHKSPEGGKKTIGPGFKLGSGLHRISEREANRGVTKYRLNQEARRLGNQHLDAVNTFLNQGQTTNPADTVSPQIKMGLMDLRHQVGPLGEWGKLRDAVLEGDIDKIRKESTVTWNDNGEVKVDKRRKNIRDNKYFHYAEGGQVEPDPLEVLERSKPKFHGIPLAKGNIDGVFSPIDVPLATLPKVWSAVNKWLPNYGPTLGALIVGDNGQPVNKSAKPIATKRIEPDVEEFYRDIVIPLRPQEDYVKNIYLNRPGTFKYNVYPDDAIPSNRVAEYNPITGEIRVKESMLNSPQLDQTLAHDGSHDLEKLQRTKEAQNIIDEALVAQKNPISKESNLIQEKGAEVTRMGYNAFKYMKDHGLIQVKNPLAKTKAYQDYILNATQEQLAEMMGDFTAYSRDYKAGKIDYDKIRWALTYAPEIAVGLIVPQHLLSNDKESKQWI